MWENPEVPPIDALESLKSADSLDCNQPSEPESSAHLDQRVSASSGWVLCCDLVVCVMWGEWGGVIWPVASGQWPVPLSPLSGIRHRCFGAVVGKSPAVTGIRRKKVIQGGNSRRDIEVRWNPVQWMGENADAARDRYVLRCQG